MHRHLIGLGALSLALGLGCRGDDEPEPEPDPIVTYDTPRIFFSGELVSNVGTGNNNNVLPVVDAKSVTIRQEYLDQYPTEPEFRVFMETPTESDPDLGVVGGWNYYGDMRVDLQNATVTGFQGNFGEEPSEEGLGDLEGASLLAPASVMTDVHPSARAGVSTRWTFDTLALTDASNVPLLSLPVGESSFYWFNGPNVRYYFTISNEKARVALADSPESPALDAFRALVEEGAGLAVQVRLNFGAGIPGQEGLAESWAQGEKVLNPFVGPATGVIMPWFGEFPGEHPRARYLVAPGGVFAGVVTLEGDQVSGEVTLDFGAGSLSEDGTGPQLELALSGESLATVGPEAYGNAAREFLVDVAVAPEGGLASGDLVLTDDTGAVVFEERPQVVIADPIGLWVDEDEAGTVTLQVLERGVPLAGATVSVQQYGYDEEAKDYFKDIALLETPDTLTTDADGLVQFEPLGVGAGRAMIAYRLDAEPFPDAHSATDGVFDTFVRVLPAYDDAAISDEELTWDVLYEEVLQYYDLIYPGMNEIFDIGDEQTMRQGAALVLSRLDELGPESPYFMPVTRDMSAGKRRLLKRWLQKASE